MYVWESTLVPWRTTHVPICLYTAKRVCTPFSKDTKVLFKHKDQMTRELVEPYHAEKEGESCIHQSSVSLREKESNFINTMFTWRATFSCVCCLFKMILSALLRFPPAPLRMVIMHGCLASKRSRGIFSHSNIKTKTILKGLRNTFWT